MHPSTSLASRNTSGSTSDQFALSLKASKSPAPRSKVPNRQTPRLPAELLRSCVGKDDADAWTELTERFRPAICRRIKSAARLIGLLVTEAEALEICQDLFLKLYTCDKPFRGHTLDEFDFTGGSQSDPHLNKEFLHSP